MNNMLTVNVLELREALEASWDSTTSYLGVTEDGNPALGQCYPTSWVVQRFFPTTEIVEGEVWTGEGIEKHFWNVISHDEVKYHLDLTWQQFPTGSTVRGFRIRDRQSLGDGPATVKRCRVLLERVNKYLACQLRSSKLP